jgi:hypothetical protein
MIFASCIAVAIILFLVGINAGISLYKRYLQKHCVFCTGDFSSDAICAKCRKDIIDGARDAHDIRFDNVIPMPIDKP